MNMQDGMSSLLEREMDRKDFLKLVGVGLVAMTGVGSVIKTLNGANIGSTRKQSLGYGSMVYGGTKKLQRLS